MYNHKVGDGIMMAEEKILGRICFLNLSTWALFWNLGKFVSFNEI